MGLPSRNTLLDQAVCNARRGTKSANEKPRPRPRAVPNPSADPRDTRVPNGAYELAYLKFEEKYCFSRLTWFTYFRIVEPGEHFGKILFRKYFAPRKDQTRLPRASNLRRDYIALMQKRPSKGGIKLKPHHFLKGQIVLGHTRTVTFDSDQRPIPEFDQYSVIDRLECFTAGDR